VTKLKNSLKSAGYRVKIILGNPFSYIIGPAFRDAFEPPCSPPFFFADNRSQINSIMKENGLLLFEFKRLPSSLSAELDSILGDSCYLPSKKLSLPTRPNVNIFRDYLSMETARIYAIGLNLADTLIASSHEMEIPMRMK